MVLASLAAFSQARNFTDDRGVVFDWDDNGPRPKVVVNANGAIALFNLGKLGFIVISVSLLR